mgnify:CR=1 FL=1
MIIACAEQIILEEGLDGLSMNKVAARAGLAKGTLYLYFANKEDIVGHLALLSRHKLLTYFHETISAYTEPRDQVRAIFWASYAFSKKSPIHYSLVSFYESRPEAHESKELELASLNISGYIKSVLDRAQSQGVIGKHVDTSHLVFSFWGISIGMIQLVEKKDKYIQESLNIDSESYYHTFNDNFVDSLR